MFVFRTLLNKERCYGRHARSFPDMPRRPGGLLRTPAKTAHGSRRGLVGVGLMAGLAIAGMIALVW
jgi:hypothetical protein